MDPFSAELTQVIPALAADACAEFRMGLLAIAQHLEEDPSCQAWSLEAWGTWLSDGGFDPNTLGAILREICQATLAEPAAAELLQQCQLMAAADEGIPLLVEVVTNNHPALAERMERLEALAHNVTTQMESRAGGTTHLSTGAKWGIAGGSVVVGAGIGYLVHRSRKAAAAELQRQEQELEQHMIREIKEKEPERWYEMKVENNWKRVLNGARKEVLSSGETSTDLFKAMEESRSRADLFQSISKHIDISGIVERKIEALSGENLIDLRQGLLKDLHGRLREYGLHKASAMAQENDILKKIADKSKGGGLDEKGMKALLKDPEFQAFADEHIRYQLISQEIEAYKAVAGPMASADLMQYLEKHESVLTISAKKELNQYKTSLEADGRQDLDDWIQDQEIGSRLDSDINERLGSLRRSVEEDVLIEVEQGKTAVEKEFNNVVDAGRAAERKADMV